MSAQDDSASVPVRPYTDRWVAESPFVGEAAAEEQAPNHPWYQGYTPFVESREEMYGPEAKWGSDQAASEAERPFKGTFKAFVERPRSGIVL